MSPSSSPFGSEIWTTDLWLQQDYGREGSYSSYVVRTPTLAKAKEAAIALKNFRSERNLVALRGAIPGPKGGLVLIRKKVLEV